MHINRTYSIVVALALLTGLFCLSYDAHAAATTKQVAIMPDIPPAPPVPEQPSLSSVPARGGTKRITTLTQSTTVSTSQNVNQPGQAAGNSSATMIITFPDGANSENSTSGQSGRVASSPQYKWKVATPFEISFIDGFHGVYPVGEPIEFRVEGRSPVQVEALPENGFNLTATIYDLPRTTAIQNAQINFDAARRAWLVAFTAPYDNTRAYEIELNLNCSRDESHCAEIYGRSAQTTKLLALHIN